METVTGTVTKTKKSDGFGILVDQQTDIVHLTGNYLHIIMGVLLNKTERNFGSKNKLKE